MKMYTWNLHPEPHPAPLTFLNMPVKSFNVYAQYYVKDALAEKKITVRRLGAITKVRPIQASEFATLIQDGLPLRARRWGTLH